MKLFVKDGGKGKFRVFVCCEKCRKLIRDYRFGPDSGISIKDSAKIVDTVKARMKRADYQYCYHCGEKNFREGEEQK